MQKEELEQQMPTNQPCHAMPTNQHGGKILTSTFVNDTAKLWNIAPESIKQSESVYSAKKNIKIYTSSLPI